MLAGSLGIEHFVSNSDHDYINFIILNNSINLYLHHLLTLLLILTRDAFQNLKTIHF